MVALTDYTFSSLAKVLDVTFTGVDQAFTGVSTDTRTLKPGDLFVALKGPNFDGHHYVQQAMEKGAVGAVVEQNIALNIPQFKVENTLQALGVMAKARRQAFNGKLVGLTGSNGKTTVKELIASILKLEGKVLATQGNFNNNIGLPLTLLKIANDEAYAVIEMGANHPGEIAYLTSIAQPDVAIITNAGAAHLEGFGSIEGVAHAKGEIFQGLKPEGCAVINVDDQYADVWLNKTQKFKQIRFALKNPQADIKATDIKPDQEKTGFILQAFENSVEVQLPLSGNHNVANALAAGSAAVALGISLKTIKQGLELFQAVKGRQNFVHHKSGAIVIDDTYNANLDSMKAGINVLAGYRGKKILVVGDLFEVGTTTSEVHQQLGEYAKSHGIDELLAVGEFSQNTVMAFGKGAQHFASKQELINCLKAKLGSEVTVLVKGSRGMRMEEVVLGIC